MKSLYVLAFLASLNTYADAQPIEPSSAKEQVGKTVTTCGVISKVKPFSKGTYLSFGPSFPKEHLTAVVWNGDLQAFVSKFGGLDALTGRKACVRGKVTTYKGHAQIELSAPDRLFYAE
jgi:hypothetical protein